MVAAAALARRARALCAAVPAAVVRCASCCRSPRSRWARSTRCGRPTTVQPAFRALGARLRPRGRRPDHDQGRRQAECEISASSRSMEIASRCRPQDPGARPPSEGCAGADRHARPAHRGREARQAPTARNTTPARCPGAATPATCVSERGLCPASSPAVSCSLCSFLLARRRPSDPVALLFAFAFAGLASTIDPRWRCGWPTAGRRSTTSPRRSGSTCC